MTPKAECARKGLLSAKSEQLSKRAREMPGPFPLEQPLVRRLVALAQDAASRS